MVFDSMSYCKIKDGDDKTISTKWSTVIGWEKNFSLLRRIAKSEGRVGAIKSSGPAPVEPAEPERPRRRTCCACTR